MSEVVVTTNVGHHFIGINHAATIDDEGVYVWCYGPTASKLWVKAPEGAVVNCMTCLAYGPRGDWQPHPMGRIRFDVKSGQRVGVVDTETHEQIDPLDERP